jgi:hypothetical protein
VKSCRNLCRILICKCKATHIIVRRWTPYDEFKSRAIQFKDTVKVKVKSLYLIEGVWKS